MDKKQPVRHSIVIPELYFLISKFLSTGPLENTAKILVQELEQKKVLPKRTDWLGNEHDQTFAELERKYPHIGPQHLLEICCRIGPILDKELPPSVSGVISLLGSGRQSLLKTKDSICRPRSLVDYCTHLHGSPLPDSLNCKPTHNLLKIIIGRESGVAIGRKLLIPTSFYSKIQLLRRTLGHLSAVYCVLFDRSGRYIITGADDLLIKLWSAVDGRLLATFRGASAEITDIAVNLDNTLLAAGSIDRILRVWDLQTTAPIAVLQRHTGMITSVNFCPSPRGDLKYLVTTSTDGSVAFWQYTTPRCAKTVFAPKPIQYLEKLRPGQAQMICASFSPGGIFLATGSADHHVRIYMLVEGPRRILETEAHTDTVDSIQWAHKGLRFVSASKDGTALVWIFESQQWKSMKLNMTDKLPSCPETSDETKKLRVTMVSWDFSDKWVITAVNDFTIKVWDARTGTLHRVLRGHKDEIYVLESHPKDEHVLLSAGHDGQLFIWDIGTGNSVAYFANNIDGQGHGGVFDGKWSPDGTMIAATDSHGHILTFGIGASLDRFKELPLELFFHTDYRPLLRDANHMVLDEQTQMMPHLMPPPFLVDVDGNPYPPSFQRLVPGREHCPSEQLVPNISFGPEGVEVIDNSVVSHLDRLIEALANRYNQDQAPDTNNDRGNPYRVNNSPRANGSNSHRGALRRTGDVEGVRQSSGNWQRETSFKWIRRQYVKPMKYSQLQALRQAVYSVGQDEQDIYCREMRRRPIMITTGNSNNSSQGLGMSRETGTGRSARGARAAPRPLPAYRTRAVREREPEEAHEEEEEEEEDTSSNSSEDTSFSTGVNEEMLSESSSSDEESSDYSDWVADKPGPNLEPPKRSKRKPVERRNFSPSSDTNQTASKSRSKKKITTPPENGEIPDVYRPSEWLTEVIPRKAPYYPQMGDEVVYFCQGHSLYVQAVRMKKIYKLNSSSEPWKTMHLRDHELVRIIGMKYEIKPPRLCCLKLAIIDENGQMTGKTFTIKYHDMPDVIDFLVLRQTYDTAVARNWKRGDRFRCMIDDAWWMGQIESRCPLSSIFPDSLFMCFHVRWDNGEFENMSPWDMEPIDENRLPAEVGGAVRVLPEELRATLYQPKAEEWPRGDRDASCRRIIAGLEQVMGLRIAEAFLVPVDLNIYPAYAYIIEYPIDLTTIKARFENHFYRRITSAQFDVRYLATNAEKFNQLHSNIVKHARIITDLCLRIIRDQNDVDVGAVYHQLVATYISSESENENDNDNDNGPVPSTSTATPSTSRKPPATRVARTPRKKSIRFETDWRVDCRQLLDMLWQCDDSRPFREPVDTMEHPDYLQIVDTPMDLRTIKEDLLGGNYANPLEFAKDVRLIIQNSRNYNTNKKSRIYSMTLRLSTLFETHVKDVIYNWTRANKTNAKKNSTSDRNKPGPSSRPGPSTRATTSNSTANRHIDSSDDESDNDDNAPRKGRPTNGRISRRTATSSTNNKVTSTMPAVSTAGPSGRILRKNPSRPSSQDNSREGHSNAASTSSSTSSSSSASSSSSSTSSSSSEDDNDSDAEGNSIAISELEKRNRRKRPIGKSRANDSEDSYKPNDERQARQKSKIKKRKRSSADVKVIVQKNKKSKSVHKDQKNVNKVNKKRIYQRRKPSTDDNRNTEGDRSSDNEKPKTNRRNPPNKRDALPPRKTRQNVEENHRSIPGTSGSNLRPRTNRRHELDHSYHLPTKSGRRRTLTESDPEDREPPRPTRSAARRTTRGWDREERNDDSPPVLPRRQTVKRNVRTRKKNSSESCVSSDEILSNYVRYDRRSSYSRLMQIQRSETRSDNQTTDEEIHNNVYTRTSRARERDTTGTPSYSEAEVDPHESTSRRRVTAQATSSSTITRSQANSGNSLDALPSSSSGACNQHFRSHVQVDHNYGEPGPSSIRFTRQTLSRHQRNADELDSLASDIDPLLIHNSSSVVLENITTRLRGRNPVNSITTNRNEIEPSSQRQLRQVRIERANYEIKLEQNGNGHLNSDESTDSEDNRPLTYVAAASSSRALAMPSTSSETTRNTRRARYNYADDVDINNIRSSRNTRNLKRPRYNENSEDSSDPQPLKRRTGMRSSPSSPTYRQRYAPTSSTRLDDNVESDNDQTVSISSRGRVRKITAKARGLFRD